MYGKWLIAFRHFLHNIIHVVKSKATYVRGGTEALYFSDVQVEGNWYKVCMRTVDPFPMLLVSFFPEQCLGMPKLTCLTFLRLGSSQHDLDLFGLLCRRS